MKILMLNSYYEPEIAASLYLCLNLNEELSKNNFQVQVYTPMPCRGISDEIRKRFIKNKTEKINENLIIHRFSLPKEKTGTISRAMRYFALNIVLFFKGLFSKTDLIFLYSTPPTNGLMGAVLKFFKRKPFIYDLQDVFPDSMINAGMTSKGSFVWKIGRWMENVTYKSADKIIVISEDIKNNIIAKGVPESKIEIVPNWVDENLVKYTARKDNVLFDRYNLDRNKFYIAYSGNIGFSQNMDMLVDVAQSFKSEKDIKFVIVGDGAYKEKLIENIKEKNIDNITVLPFQSYDEISNVFSLGDAGLIISKSGIGSNSVPSKTWSIMSAERPILASFDKDSELCSIIEKNNCGVCIPPDNSTELRNAILYFFNSKEKAKTLGENGRKYILNNLTRDIGTGKIIKIIQDTLNCK